ncbi:MAG TPA: carbohydrate-binding protein [Vicinamibacterales bacterium]|nr:carbohydrate-binding protein [Vicinamibacterales bacterium]
MRLFVSAAMIRSLALAIAALITAVSSPLRAQSAALVPAGSTWRYLDDGSNQGTAWRTPAFNDSAWATGRAQLGYGDGDEGTVVSYGGNASAKHVTTYFRRTVSVNDPAALGSLNLRLLRDDGAVVYVNGSEVLRTNMPTGTITYTTPASAAIFGADESVWVSAVVSPSLLVAGANVIAVEVHQSEPTSSDLSFDLELLGSSSVSVTRGPYLQLGTATSLVVRWRTSVPSVGRVQYGPSPGVVAGSAQEQSERTEHEVHLTGLTPDTLYYYSIGTAAATLAGDASFNFRTSPVPGTGRPIRLWVVGDSGTADANARAVRDAYTAFTGSRATDLWLMLGDNAYNDGFDHEYQAAVFNMYPDMLRKTVLWPTYGNHDGYGADSATNTGPYYDIFTLPKQGEAGGVPSGTEAYYSFDYGNIHFVSLESFETSRSTTGPMLTWLQRDLAANTQPWVIVFFHHPPYSKGSHDSDVEIELVEMRQNALPTLENFGVDLVLAGHSHSYERSFLLDRHYGDSTTFSAAMKKDAGSGRADASGAYWKPTYGMAPHEGAVYLVAGVSGKTSGGTLNYPAMYLSEATLGSLVLDVDANRIDAMFLDSTGVRRDYFSIVKGAGGSTPPPGGAFGGTPAAVPGLVEAENFDEGGQSIAYYDTTPGNSRGAYRSTDVDIETAADSGGGFNLSKTRAGEWLKYTVNVATTGTYSLETRVANIGAGGRFHVEVDGVDRSGPVTVPETGGWQTWQTITVSGIPLTAGQRVIRISLDTAGSSGGVGNYNWFRFVAGTSPPPPSPAYGGTPAPLPGIVQAENFDVGSQGVAYVDASAGNAGGVYRSTDVDIGPTSDPSSGGYYVGWTRVGEWLKYSVNVTETRNYTLNVRVANVGSGATFRIEVDDVDRTGPIAVPNTGGWDLWQTLSVSGISLTQGPRVIRLVMLTRNVENAGVGNFSYFQFQ